ncbi:antigenic WD protein [Trypanosoma rangeli]|uniref:Antigenic WD protein n=1 Tax=Trypanosoma rangeli TaxID=5698 RepID=A0A3R7K7N9_TRYRA|nr:antigenic WD protein [Trypanosoma rangeli]RNF03107.1 antigenic WD protein [Trypanosoma rangeli]|eukprot:RNF03107.1 antigenic WD protein [Trypanosoma rangeli]
MSKAKLKFSVEGKTVVYDGRPETRAKDLLEILVKMKVNSAVAVKAFRENIEDAARYTDEDIQQLFGDAQQAYEEKKRRKMSIPAKEEKLREKLEKITLYFKGKQFSYMGLPSTKEYAVIELLIKQNAARELVIETFRKNLPESSASDEDIFSMFTEAVAAKNLRKSGTKKDTAAERTAESSTLSAELPPQEQEQEQQQQQQQQQQHGVRVSSTAGVGAIDEITGMSVEERDTISNFIKQVLEQPEMDLTAHMREEMTTLATPVTIARNPSDGAEDDSLLLTTRTTRGKLAVYCQEEKSTANKVLYISPNTTYEEFCTMLEKKFGRKMATSFYEGEDLIDMDDDDVFCMFLEMSQSQAQEGKRMKLICVPPETRKRASDDKLTDMKAGDVFKIKAFSSGKLEVCEEKSYTGHTSAVYCCSFSSKGDRFCTASRDRSVRLWNTLTGCSSVMKGGHNGFVLSCDFSPRGNRIVSSSDDRTIKVWNTATSAKVYTLKGHDDKVYCVQYNSTGDYIVSASCDHTVRIWNADSGAKMATLRSHTLAVFSCCFSNTDCGRYVVSGGDDRLIKVWNWAKDDEYCSMTGHTDTVWSCKFSHNDTRIVTASMNHELRVWDWKSKSCILFWTGHQVPIHQAIFSTNDKYIYSCARDWTVMVWDAVTGEHLETITGHHSTVYHMDVARNKLLTSSLDDTLKLWTINEKE